MQKSPERKKNSEKLSSLSPREITQKFVDYCRMHGYQIFIVDVPVELNNKLFNGDADRTILPPASLRPFTTLPGSEIIRIFIRGPETDYLLWSYQGNTKPSAYDLRNYPGIIGIRNNEVDIYEKTLPKKLNKSDLVNLRSAGVGVHLQFRHDQAEYGNGETKNMYLPDLHIFGELGNHDFFLREFVDCLDIFDNTQ